MGIVQKVNQGGNYYDQKQYYDDKQDQETNKIGKKVNQSGDYYDQKQYYDDKQYQETNKIVQKVNQGGDYYGQKQYSKIKDGQFGRGKDEYGGYLQQQKKPKKFFQQGDQNGQGWQKNKTLVFTRK